MWLCTNLLPTCDASKGCEGDGVCSFAHAIADLRRGERWIWLCVNVKRRGLLLSLVPFCGSHGSSGTPGTSADSTWSNHFASIANTRFAVQVLAWMYNSACIDGVCCMKRWGEALRSILFMWEHFASLHSCAVEKSPPFLS